jgi:hypothetical protein
MEWVAARAHGIYEEGGIYSSRPSVIARPFEPGEEVAVCPSCGQRFARIAGTTAVDLWHRHASAVLPSGGFVIDCRLKDIVANLEPPRWDQFSARNPDSGEIDF